MSASMAEVLGDHYVCYFGMRSWRCTSLQCGFESEDFSEAVKHMCEQLDAAGCGKLEDATERVGKRYAELYQLTRDELQAQAWDEGKEAGMLDYYHAKNPYRRPE